MYGSDTTSRRNYALKIRRELINSKAILTGYLKYPAKLFVKKVGDITCSLLEDLSVMEVPETINED